MIIDPRGNFGNIKKEVMTSVGRGEDRVWAWFASPGSFGGDSEKGSPTE